MRITLIHNPEAGDESHSADRIRDMLAEAGHKVHLRSSEQGWKKALDRPADLVVVAGGDGTVGKVALRLAHRDVPLAVLPTGTANNIGKTLGVMGDVGEIIARWATAESRPFDLAHTKVRSGEQSFVESFGGGVMADVIAAASGREVMVVGRESDRALFLLRRVLETSDAARWSIELDGQDLSDDHLGVEILNIRFAGPNIPLAPHADPGDGLLDLVLIGERDRADLLEYAASRMEDAAATIPSLPVHQGREIRLVPPPGAMLHLDDVAWPADRDARRKDRTIEIRVDPGALSVIV